MRFFILTLAFSLLLSTLLTAQKATLSGTITDPSGETLIGVNVYDINNPAQGTTTNTYGLYSITLPADTHTIVISYIGFSTLELTIDLTKGDVERNIEMNDGEGVTLTTVEVSAEREDQNIQEARMGTVALPLDKIKELPAILGEPDPLKLAQLAPGISSATDGGSGLYVRGGGVDQNLILLDEAVVYNSGHILGFFSIFNSDALKKTTIYKGAMPANYGGRLSSVVDIQMKDGSTKNFGLDGGIGLVSSRLTAQGPIVKEKSSFIVSGRRTYAYDLARPFLTGSDFEGTNYFFYDLNAKVNYELSDKDKIFFSGYFGRDLLNFSSVLRDANFGINYGNLTGTFRWNHKINNRLFMNTSVIYNNYDYTFESRDFGIDADITSGVADWNAKVDFDYALTPHNIKFGANFIRHKLTPNVVEFTAANENENSPNLFGRSGVRYGNEYAIYALDDYKINSSFSINVGIRATAYTLYGPYTSILTGQEFSQGEPVVNHYGIEPRLLGNYILSDESSFKAGFAITNQYLHMVTNSASSLPLEIWVPSTDRVLPQRGWQASMGYFQNFQDNQYEFSIEGYFRNFKNQIDYAENYVNDPTLELEEQFVFGNGLAYGLEFFLRKRKGDLTGWLSYTAARTERLFPEINNGRPYPALQDRPHDFSALLSYNLNPKWQLSAIFVYSSGTPITPIRGFFIVEQNVNYLFGARNSQRMQPYHRLDLSATILPNKDNPNYESSWTIAVYNIYDNRNPLFQYYVPEQDEETGQLNLEGRNVSFFPVIPSLTWNFSWKPKSAVEKTEVETSKQKTGL